jgi:2'-5' RNA ligase
VCPISQPGPNSGDPHANDPTVENPAADTMRPWEQATPYERTASFRFHFTATWTSVREKAKRIRSEGGVNIVASPDPRSPYIVANVKGDHGTYECTIMRAPGRKTVAMWECGCDWSKYAWGRSGRWKRLEGRPCSHVVALIYEAQSQEMFGGDISVGPTPPHWGPVVQPDNTKAPYKYPRAASMHEYVDDPIEIAPATIVARGMLEDGYTASEVLHALTSYGASDGIEIVAQALRMPFTVRYEGEFRTVMGVDDEGVLLDGIGVVPPDSTLLHPDFDPITGLWPVTSALATGGDVDIESGHAGPSRSLAAVASLPQIRVRPIAHAQAHTATSAPAPVPATHVTAASDGYEEEYRGHQIRIERAGGADWFAHVNGQPEYPLTADRTGAMSLQRARAWIRKGMPRDNGTFSQSATPEEARRMHEEFMQKIRERSHEAQANSNGVMVAIAPPTTIGEAIALPGGEAVDELHVTLAYLGNAADVDYDALRSAVEDMAAAVRPLTATVQGLGVFQNDENVLWAAVDAPGLEEWRSTLVGCLADYGLAPISNHGFTPHMTLKYSENAITELPDLDPEAKAPWPVPEVVLAHGGTWERIPVTGHIESDEDPLSPPGEFGSYVADDFGGPVIFQRAAAADEILPTPSAPACARKTGLSRPRRLSVRCTGGWLTSLTGSRTRRCTRRWTHPSRTPGPGRSTHATRCLRFPMQARTRRCTTSPSPRSRAPTARMRTTSRTSRRASPISTRVARHRLRAIPRSRRGVHASRAEGTDRGRRARGCSRINLDALDIVGTHYEQVEALYQWRIASSRKA